MKESLIDTLLRCPWKIVRAWLTWTNNKARRAYSNLFLYSIFLMSSIFFSLKWWMLKKQRIHDVKGSALEKTCWDENVQLKWLHNLCLFSSFYFFISACSGERIFKAVTENVNILSSDKISQKLKFSTSKKLVIGVAWQSSAGNWKKECKTNWLISLTFFEISYSSFSRGSGRFDILWWKNVLGSIAIRCIPIAVPM